MLDAAGVLAWLTFFVLLATLGAIVWYSVETRWLRQETALQTELRLRPLLTISCFDDDQVMLTNIGNGIAREIRLEDTVIESGADHQVVIRWSPVDYVKPDEHRALSGRIIRRDEHGDETEFPGDQHGIAAHLSRFAVGLPRRHVTAEYKNLVNASYRTTIVVDQGFPTIVEDRKL